VPRDKGNEDREDSIKDDDGKPLFISLKPYSHYRKNRNLAIAGLVLLVIGFSLQIIGNWLQNPPS